MAVDAGAAKPMGDQLLAHETGHVAPVGAAGSGSPERAPAPVAHRLSKKECCEVGFCLLGA